ncbi:MAG: rod shape-determining protein MreC [Deltaproteobacteria bacterium]|nr:rod shape-determining protein MreC [Deltaproteobacteria bacterium]
MQQLHRLRFAIPVLLLLFFYALLKIDDRRAPWYEILFFNMVSPFTSVLCAVSSGTSNVWHGYVALIGVAEENDRLKRQVAELSQAVHAFAETKLENGRLRELLSYPNDAKAKMLGARVVAADPKGQFQTLVISRGTKDGVGVAMPVMGPKGIVGRIGKVYRSSAIVLLLNDLSSAVDVANQRSGARALLVGTVKGTHLRHAPVLTRLEYLDHTSDVKPGDVIVTSGFDQIFPPGLPVGTVGSVEPLEEGIFQKAEVIPYENLFELKDVVVMLTAKAEE